MHTQLRIRLFAVLFAVIAASSLLAVISVSASHRTTMDICGSHGLGPNFAHAEGSNSALIQCLENSDTAHSTSASVSLHTPISYREALRIMDTPRVVYTYRLTH